MDSWTENDPPTHLQAVRVRVGRDEGVGSGGAADEAQHVDLCVCVWECAGVCFCVCVLCNYVKAM